MMCYEGNVWEIVKGKRVCVKRGKEEESEGELRTFHRSKTHVISVVTQCTHRLWQQVGHSSGLTEARTPPPPPPPAAAGSRYRVTNGNCEHPITLNTVTAAGPSLRGPDWTRGQQVFRGVVCVKGESREGSGLAAATEGTAKGNTRHNH
ncbi:hypothetical protein Pmani_025169 [Petrolisthes manimaculis]|uniref:Uncharacterized protein n=1 Tax=Petrolisthes manimaculis TaxID=1843537 RepID=A0AAE1U1F9_9EUCA|nr:hypothetical protein Pmani_025169 [Petrolisthes manimaculis]